jgi:hypothetical protein
VISIHGGGARSSLLHNSSQLAVSVTGDGPGVVTSDPASFTCAVGQYCDSFFLDGSLVTLTATPEIGSTFSGWLGQCSGLAPCQLVVDGPYPASVGATFTLNHYELSATVDGTGTGSIAATDGFACPTGTCTATYTHGTVLSLTATPSNNDDRFSGWSGACSGTGACVVAMDAAKAVTATFTHGGPK